MAVQGEFHQVASDTKSPCGLNQGHKYPPADGGIQNSQRDTGNQLLTTRIRFRLQKKYPSARKYKSNFQICKSDESVRKQDELQGNVRKHTLS